MRHIISFFAVLVVFFTVTAQHPQRMDVPYGFVNAKVMNVDLSSKTLDCVISINTYQWKGADEDRAIESERVDPASKWVISASYKYLVEEGDRWRAIHRDFKLASMKQEVSESGVKNITYAGKLSYEKGVPETATKLLVKVWYNTEDGTPGWINQLDPAFNDDGNGNYCYAFVVDLETKKVFLYRER